MTGLEALDIFRYLHENELRFIISNFFCKEFDSVSLSKLVHGSFERGADVILCFDKEIDVLGRGFIILIQVKKGNIDLPTWRKSLHSQLFECYDREVNTQPYTSMDVPRRVVLITSGIISEPVQYRITRINKKNHIPIETFDGSQFATLMNKKGYRGRDDVEPLIVRKYF